MDANQIKPGTLHILIVDDEPNIRKTLATCLSIEGHAVTSVSNPGDAVEEAKRHSFDMAFVDLRLGDEDGMNLIPQLLAELPWIKIVVITAYATIETAVQAMKTGAADYIAKPFTPDQIRVLTTKVARIRALEREISSLKDDIKRLDPQPTFQSQNSSMQRAIETAKKAAQSEAVILLQGESGTGKSVFARAVHLWSERAKKPFVVVSCPAVPPDLLETEIFGHVKGAFTGAVRDNPGRIALSEGGTLFLDEIADIAPSVQSKLLRFIQDREYEKVGDPTPRKADVRIIVATNADLEQAVAAGRFRQDLYYRINVISIVVPPLRERPEDILPLASGFLLFFNRANHKSVLGLTDEAADAIQTYPWPGNLRELRNALERAVILGGDERISKEDLPAPIAGSTRGAPALGDRVPLAQVEELHIRRVLAAASSLQEAADILGIDQATLWRKRKTYGI
ncbi:MAG: sigma-54-dependent Fis family transcriptional regulator [Deltaproteobacteria bacterium HGW-Deltaproteobacteria-15]|jgi:NtrC-family two-component system response regulator AlgB|nr:MAG: sigma-54-dependent Fis family transcriptional regulator [Deltaproteobacteria bacterium HGW-Deltaproteobacteria-15]